MIKENQNSQNIEELLFRMMEGEISAVEKRDIQRWMEESKDNTQKFDEFKLQYHWFKKGRQSVDFNKEESWNRIKAAYYKSGYQSEISNRKL